ncbi:hypothetical protein B0H13DRAFT_2358613 [Mycena leptocephala]|nr:hypothetical protein B0H13DRAFT_2358613 [Mycena leptocephala]
MHPTTLFATIGCVSVYVATVHRSRPTPTRFAAFCTRRWVLHREPCTTLPTSFISLASWSGREAGHINERWWMQGSVLSTSNGMHVYLLHNPNSAPASSFVLPFTLLHREHLLLILTRSPSSTVRDDW